MRPLSPNIAFAMFVILLAARDVGADLLLLDDTQESRTCLAFLICATISVLSFAILAVNGDGLGSLPSKLQRKGVRTRVIALGLWAAVVYLVTFNMIGRKGVGAGLFDLFDYGLAPILAAGLGVLMFNEIFKKRLIVVLPMYLVGLFFLFWHHDLSGLAWMALAVLSPIGTSLSDALTKWLLSAKGGLSRSEVLFVRFMPATIIIAVWVFANGQSIHLHEAILSMPLAVVGGFAPLWFLCYGLERADLSKYAIWECLIPVVAFAVTLLWHPDTFTFLRGLGAILIVLALVVNEI